MGPPPWVTLTNQPEFASLLVVVSCPHGHCGGGALVIVCQVVLSIGGRSCCSRAVMDLFIDLFIEESGAMLILVLLIVV